MPTPFANKSGVFVRNVRVPHDLRGKLRRTRVTLPVGDMLVTISVSDKVFLSLQTKDPNLARTGSRRPILRWSGTGRPSAQAQSR